jgi:geranylgeranyl diphosphate synthase type II
MRDPLIKTDVPVLTSNHAKELVDEYLSSVLSERVAQAAGVHPHYERLWQAITRLYTAGGKRLRPYMILLMYQAYSQKPVEHALPAAAAQELLHQSILIHDDIIDRDTIRYHIKNISGQYDDTYKDLISDNTIRRHFADSSALLAGDLLISEAHMQITRLDIDKKLFDEIHHLMSQSVFHVAGGELLDTEASFEKLGVIDPLTVAEQKTASYSFVGPLMIGAVLGGATEDQQNILKHLGTSVGIAYQLRDDLIGLFGDADTTGKSTDGDIREGKHTVLIEEFYKRADDAQKEQFMKIFGNHNADSSTIDIARQLLEKSGAREVIEGYIDNYMNETTQSLEALEISDDHKAMLSSLISASLKRDR